MKIKGITPFYFLMNLAVQTVKLVYPIDRFLLNIRQMLYKRLFGITEAQKHSPPPGRGEADRGPFRNEGKSQG